MTFGTRFSDYSNFGNTTNSKLQVEWRPIDDLLLRGTVAEVFRAPSIGDLYAGPAGNAPTAIDPLCGLYQRPGPRQRVRARPPAPPTSRPAESLPPD